MKETFVMIMNGQEVEVTFEPESDSPTREIDKGLATIKGVVGTFPYVKTSYVVNPLFALATKLKGQPDLPK